MIGLILFGLFCLNIFSPTSDHDEYVYTEQLDMQWKKLDNCGSQQANSKESAAAAGQSQQHVFATAVFDARIGQQQRFFRYSEQYLVDCIQRVKESLKGCNGVPPTFAFMLIEKDGLPLSSYCEYKSDRTGVPQRCGLEPKIALDQTKKDGLLYKASQYGTVQGCDEMMDMMTHYGSSPVLDKNAHNAK